MRARARAAGKGGVVVTGEDDRDKNERPMLGLRTKKATGVRTWLLIDIHGSAQVVEAGKHAIMRRACLPARDLRILDPVLSYPSTILGREHAIVVNLEHIKAIITAQEVLLLNSKDPAVAPFVLDLQHRLPLHFNALGQQVPGDGGGGLSDNDRENGIKLSRDSLEAGSRVTSSHDLNTVELLDAGREEQQGVVAAELPSPRLPQLCTSFKIDGSSPGQTRGGPNVLPFEFRALEACLEAACSCLDTETIKLEREAYPALDELTSKISTLNLERVRQIKSRLVAISGRVQKVLTSIPNTQRPILFYVKWSCPLLIARKKFISWIDRHSRTLIVSHLVLFFVVCYSPLLSVALQVFLVCAEVVGTSCSGFMSCARRIFSLS
jgi:hypothetical protein